MPESEPSTLPSILAAELKAGEWSINRLARAAGLSPNVVHTIVNGDTPNPGVKTVEKILGVLGRDWGWVHRQGVRPEKIRNPGNTTATPIK